MRAHTLAWMTPLLGFPAGAFAGTFRVPGDADTIAEALALSTGDWDTITVSADYVPEAPVTITHSVMIEGEGGAVSFPPFVIDGGALRLTGGLLYGDTPVAIGAVSVLAAVAVVDGSFEGSALSIHPGSGYGIFALGGAVSLRDSSVLEGSAGPAVFLYGSYGSIRLTVEGVRFEQNLAGAIYATDSQPDVYDTAVTVVDSSFVLNRAVDSGADLRLEAIGGATVSGTSFEGADAPSRGGSIHAVDTDLAIDGLSSFASNRARFGASVYAVGTTRRPTVTISDTTFSGGTASTDEGAGGEVAAAGVDLVLRRVVAEGGSARYGAFLVADAVTVTAEDVEVRGGEARSGGAFFLQSSIASFDGLSACGSDAVNGGVLYAADSSVVLERTLVHANRARLGGVIEVQSGSVGIGDATFVSNESAAGSVYGTDTQLTLVNTIFAGDTGAVTLLGSSSVPWAGFNLYDDLGSSGPVYSTVGGDVYADPQFDGFSAGVCASLPRLSPTSPAVDAGDPSRLDVDGTRSDIGAFDVEADDTGVPDDTGAPDDTGIPDDTGADPVLDADGDGSPNEEDCRPGDPDVYPGAYDDPADAIDQDCDGDAASARARGGCGCAAGEPGAGLALTVLALASLRRRSAPLS